MRRWLVLAIFTTIAIVFSPQTAFGHAEEPTAEWITGFGEGAFLAEANFGLVGSHFRAQYVCEEAFLGGDSFIVVALGPDEWITFGETTIQRTSDGCDFEKVRDLSDAVSDASAHHESGSVAFVSNRDGDRGLWVSEDRGQSFEKIDLEKTGLRMTGVRFMAADTLLVSGYMEMEDARAVLIRVDLVSATAMDLPVPEGLTYPYVLAAGGGHFVWLVREESQVIAVGTPQEPMLHRTEAPGWPSGASISSDGETVWIGGTNNGRGVMVGDLSGAAASWETVAEETTARCLGRNGETLYVCGQRERDGADLLRILPDGTVEPMIDFTEITGSRESCAPESDVGEVCPLVWEDLALYLGKDPDAGGDDDAEAPVEEREDDSVCQTALTGASPAPFALLFLLAALAWYRRRTPGIRPPTS